MSFDELLTDTVSVIKTNGDIIPGVNSSVQKDKIFIQRADILIEAGDLIQRKMSNGAEETFRVIDPGFNEAFHGIPAGYQMDVTKLGVPEAKAEVMHVTYNVSGTNNRINQSSTDNSINVTNSNSDALKYIDSLRLEIERLNLPKEEADASYEVIDAVEAQFETEKPSKAAVKALLSSLPHAGNIASICSFIFSLMV